MASSSVTVLCPNARRVTVKTTPNTSILQILEEACAKQNYNADSYTLKHLKRPLDVTATLRFAGLPNRCVLDMLELPSPRTQQPVIVCLIDEQGGKYVKEYTPAATLWEVVLASGACQDPLPAGLLPTVVYSMRKVAGREALTVTTLKELGLNSGRGSLRFVNEKLDGPPPSAAAPRQEVTAAPPPPVNNQPLAMPEVIPVQMPEIIPVNVRPEVIPVSIPFPAVPSASNNSIDGVSSNQPEIIPQVNPPEILAPLLDRPDVFCDVPSSSNNGGRSLASPPSSTEDHRRMNDVDRGNEALPVAGQLGGDGASTGGGGASSVLAPDLVHSSQGSTVPDVVMREDTSLPPDVLTNEGCSSTIEAFSGSGHSLSSTAAPPATAAAAEAAWDGSGPSNASAAAGCQDPGPSQLMEVDSTQDTALIALSSHSAVVFRGSSVPVSRPQSTGREEDDSFFELTQEEIRKLYREHQRELAALQEAPLLTQGLREAEQQSKILAAINKFPVTQLRIHFPGDVVVQASFKPTDTVQDVAVLVAELLQQEGREFDLLSHYPRRPLSRSSTLYAAGLVPKAHVHCCLGGGPEVEDEVLKPVVLARISTYEHAESALVNSRGSKSTIGLAGSGPSTSGVAAAAAPAPLYSGVRNTAVASDPKKPKWFKLGK